MNDLSKMEDLPELYHDWPEWYYDWPKYYDSVNNRYYRHIRNYKTEPFAIDLAIMLHE